MRVRRREARPLFRGEGGSEVGINRRNSVTGANQRLSVVHVAARGGGRCRDAFPPPFHLSPAGGSRGVPVDTLPLLLALLSRAHPRLHLCFPPSLSPTSPQATRVAFLSTPSIYFSLKDEKVKAASFVCVGRSGNCVKCYSINSHFARLKCTSLHL